MLIDWNHMLKLSKKTDYSVILLSHLGVADSPVSAQEIAGLYDLPHPMGANILKQLCVAGMVVNYVKYDYNQKLNHDL